MRSNVARLGLGLALLTAPLVAHGAPLIPRSVFFGPTERFQPVLSPDGKILAYLAADKEGFTQVWLRNTDKANERPVTSGFNASLRIAAWAHDGRTLLFAADVDGRGASHLFGYDLPTSNVRDYTPFRGVEGSLFSVSQKLPKEILVGLNLRDRRAQDVFRVNLESGAVIPDTENSGEAQRFLADEALQVRVAVAATPSGGIRVLGREDERSLWRSLASGSPDDVVTVPGISRDGKRIVVASSAGSDTAVVVEQEVGTAKERVVAGSNLADVEEVLVDPVTGTAQAAAFAPERRQWTVLDKALEPDFQGIRRLAEGDFSILSRDAADKLWVLGMVDDRGPMRFYLWDRAAKKGTLLFTSAKRLEGQAFAAQKAVSFKARDGLQLGGYLTVPAGSSGKGLPMVVLVRRDPWTRDHWGYEPRVQWLANRGYVVLQVNTRGSSGFGKKFRAAGYREWGRKMQEDLADGVAWAVKEGVADAKRVAIVGSGYGGFAALAGITLTPDLYAAAVAESAPSSLQTVVSTVPAVFAPAVAMFKARVGDPSSEAERMGQVSPLQNADRIKTPLLLAEPDADPRTKPDADRLVAALEKRGAKVTYVVYSGEEGQVSLPPNELDLAARTEAFLAKYLGGRAEPGGDRPKGSTAVVKVARE
jgi:dipeptidyl aminopeptidase/acylaminoacyl peptidase